MKEQITGYLTAMINSHSNRAANIMTSNVHAAKNMEGFIDELNDLLDFVEDIREEKKEPIAVHFHNNDEEVKKLKKYIKELEEGCKLNNEVILKQSKRIQSLENENKQLQEKEEVKAPKDRFETLEGLEKTEEDELC